MEKILAKQLKTSKKPKYVKLDERIQDLVREYYTKEYYTKETT